MLIDRYRQQPNENRRRLVDYDEWLDEDEALTAVVTSVTPTTSPAFVVGSASILSGAREVEYFTSGGVTGNEYTVMLRVTTSDGQIREDEVGIQVEEDDG